MSRLKINDLKKHEINLILAKKVYRLKHISLDENKTVCWKDDSEARIFDMFRFESLQQLLEQQPQFNNGAVVTKIAEDQYECEKQAGSSIYYSTGDTDIAAYLKTYIAEKFHTANINGLYYIDIDKK
jgi:hypothetical protein